MDLSASTPQAELASNTPRLRRVLSLRDLVFYGIVAVTPSAPVTVFGVASVNSRGHALLTILLAMAAMVLTAVCYGRMAALYPAAGSAYTYVGRGLNPHLGFLAGWAMLLDYLIIPLFCVIYGSLTVQRLIPGVPFTILAAAFALGITTLNLLGIRTTAWANCVLLAFMMAVLLVVDVMAAIYVAKQHGWQGLFSTLPFYNPATFEFKAVIAATSFAALTYIGFDSITTLAEDVENPRRNVLLATVLVCLFTGLFGGLLIYLAQLVWPDYTTFSHVETAFMDVTQRAGGALLFQAMAVLLAVANVGAGLTGQVGAARLLFGMGRDGVLPRRLFAHLDSRTCTPTFNIALLGLFSFAGALVTDYETAGEVLNFGAFLGFMGVNLAAFRQFYLLSREGHSRSFLRDALVPLLGFLFCLAIWLGLSPISKKLGGAWFLVGITYLLIQTRGLRLKPAMIDFSESPS
jgi:amino acid transporter